MKPPAADLPGAHATEPSVAETSWRLLDAIVSCSNDAIVAKDLNGIITFWNAEAERLLGYSADEMIGRSILAIIPDDRVDEERMIIRHITSGKRLTHFETLRRTKDGRLIPLSLTVSPIRDRTGAIVGVSKVARDLSDLQLLNATLTRQQLLLTSVLETIPSGLVIIDETATIVSVNRATENMFQRSALELAGQNVSSLMSDPDARAHDSYVRRYRETGEANIIGRGRVVSGRRKDGSEFPLHLHIGEVLTPTQRLFVGSMTDLSSHREQEHRLATLQSELIHVSRLGDLGQIASTLAHELNQPLTATTTYVAAARRLLAANRHDVLAEVLEKIGQQTTRAGDILQGIRSLLKKEPRPRQVENLDVIIREMGALVLVGQGSTVHLEIRVAPDAWTAFIDRVQIQQVIFNLMRNGVEAMRDSAVRQLFVRTERQGDRIEIRIADSGPGIAEDIKDRLFQPFMTTKAEGLGVGLSICRTIVEAHGGELRLVPQSGSGATFTFTVPAAENEAEPQ